MWYCPHCDAPLACGCKSCTERRTVERLAAIFDGDEVGCPVCHKWAHVDQWLDAEARHDLKLKPDAKGTTR